MLTMKFCLSCGNEILLCGSAEQRPEVTLYGCLSCETMYEEEPRYSTEGKLRFLWRTIDPMLSEWRVLQKNK